MSEYNQQAVDFLESTNTKIVFVDGAPDFYDYFNDGTYRYVSKVQLIQDGVKFKPFTFGHSLSQGSKRPSEYDILACLTKYDPTQDIWEFAEEYGYKINSKKEFDGFSKIHEAVIKEWDMVSTLWNEEELEVLREIS
jgi:hypothetical protein